MNKYDISPYVHMAPVELRRLVRSGKVKSIPTAGMCAGYAQANLVILPGEYAKDFREYARRNPGPCPLLEVLNGDPHTYDMGEDGNILTDIPEYFIYKDGRLAARCSDATPYWQAGMVGFLIGCSFSFEEALMKAGVEVRHIAMGRNVPMFKTSVMTDPVGPFSGPTVCSMRPMKPEDALKAYEITAAMPNVHGAPIQIGAPEKIGEVPVFWPCGVTPQAAIENARPPIVITHSPGHMFITDILNSELNDYLERKKQDP